MLTENIRTKIVMVIGVIVAVVVVIAVLNHSSLRDSILSKTSRGNSSGHRYTNKCSNRSHISGKNDSINKGSTQCNIRGSNNSRFTVRVEMQQLPLW